MNIKSGFLLGLLIFTACGKESRTNSIFVEVSPESLILEQRQIEKESFEKELKIVINKKVQEGFVRKELTVNLSVDKNTRRGDIADIETAMRRLNVRKVIYSTMAEKNKGQHQL